MFWDDGTVIDDSDYEGDDWDDYPPDWWFDEADMELEAHFYADDTDLPWIAYSEIPF